MFCIHCGNQIEEGDRYCAFCGKIQEIAPETVSESSEQPQVTVQLQPAVQPQIVYVQQPIEQPQMTVQPQPAVDPSANAPKKKKVPVALFVILGIVSLFVLVALIVIIILAFVLGSKIKGAGKKLGKIQNIDPNTVLEENGFYDFYENPIEVTKKETIETPTNSEEERKEDNIGQGLEDGSLKVENDLNQWDEVGNPNLYDFDWRENADSRYSDPNVEWLDASQCQGKWKGMIIYSSDGSEELVNFDMEIAPDNVTMVADWYMVHIGGNELIPEEDIEDTVFTGYEYGSGIHVESQNATIEIDEFWEKDGIQYGVGRLLLPASEESEVYFVRP